MHHMMWHGNVPGLWNVRAVVASWVGWWLMLRVLVALLGIALLSCSRLANPDAGATTKVDGPSDQVEDAVSQTVGEDPDFQKLGDFLDEFAEELRLKPEETPDYNRASGEVQFTFCPQPARPGVHLKNAVWLAYIAANEYSHLSAFAPVLSQLYFGQRGDIFWAQCGFDLHKLRQLEKAGNIPATIDQEAMEHWGVCSRDWYEEHYLKRAHPRPEGVAAAFEAYLIQESSQNSFLQFYSGGAFALSGTTFAKGSTQMVWARHADLPIVVVAFRGTEPNALKDIVIDATAWKTPLAQEGWTADWGKVHAGFMQAFRSISTKIDPLTQKPTEVMLLEKLKEIEGGTETECTMEHPCLWITGHSLGAALATLFASRVLSEIERGRHYKLRGLYTFGSPRVGNEAFKQKFTQLAAAHGVTIARFRNENDIVTRIPKLFYAHLDVLGLLAQQMGQVLLGLDVTEPLTGNPNDHPMDKYYRKLVNVLANPENAALSACSYENP